MILAEKGSVRVAGRHLESLYRLLRNHEEEMDGSLAELLTSVQRVLFDSLSIDEIERLNDETS